MNQRIRARIDSLRPLFKDPVPGVRIAAAVAIEKLEAISSIEEILVTLKTGERGARIGAIYALGEVGGEKALSALIHCTKCPEVDIRSASVAALGKLALPAVLPILAELLKDESTAVQGGAIVALRNFQPTPDILNITRQFLDANDGVLEAEAALTLAEMRDISSLSQIYLLLKSGHASTRQSAATALSIMPL